MEAGGGGLRRTGGRQKQRGRSCSVVWPWMSRTVGGDDISANVGLRFRGHSCTSGCPRPILGLGHVTLEQAGVAGQSGGTPLEGGEAKDRQMR